MRADFSAPFLSDPYARFISKKEREKDMSFRYSVPTDSLRKGDVVLDLDGQTVVSSEPHTPALGVKQVKVTTKGAGANLHTWIVEPTGVMTVIDW